MAFRRTPPTATSTLRIRGQGNGGHTTLTVANAFTNNGLIELTSIDAGYTAALVVTTGSLTNASGATIRAVPGAGGARTLAVQLDNQVGGTLDVDAALTLSRASAEHLNAGAIDLTAENFTLTQSGTTPSFTNTGTVTLGASRDWIVGGAGGLLDLSAGTVSGPVSSTLFATAQSLAFSTSTVTIPMTLTATTIVGGAVTIPSGQTLTLLNGGLTDPVTVQAGGTLLTHGVVALTTINMPTTTSTLRVQGQGNGGHTTLTVANGFTNSGLIELTSIDAGYSSILAVTTGTLTNDFNATIHSAPGAGGLRTLAARLNNSGTVDVDAALTINKPDVGHYNSNLIDLTNANLTVTQSGTAPTFGNGIIGNIRMGASRTMTVTGGRLNLIGSALIDTVVGSGASNSATLVLTGVELNFTPARVRVPMTLTTTTIFGGSLTIPSGEIVTLLDGGLSDPVTVASGGTLQTHGVVALSGTVDVQSGGTLRVKGQGNGGHTTLTVANSFTNSGTIELTSADAGYSATLNVTSGTLTNAAGGTLLSAPGAGGTRTVSGQVVNDGNLVVHASSTTVGTLNITGNYTQGSTGSLQMDLASLSSIDRLNITGTATLAGTLNVSAINGYDAVPNDQPHTIMTFGSRVGTFTTFNYPSGVWSFTPNATNVTVQRFD